MEYAYSVGSSENRFSRPGDLSPPFFGGKTGLPTVQFADLSVYRVETVDGSLGVMHVDRSFDLFRRNIIIPCTQNNFRKIDMTYMKDIIL